MDRLPFWLRDTLKVWTQYFTIVLAAIPAAALALFLLSRGLPEPITMLVGVLFVLILALAIPSLTFRSTPKNLPNPEFHIRYIVSISSPEPGITIFALPGASNEWQTILNEQFLPSSPPII